MLGQFIKYYLSLTKKMKTIIVEFLIIARLLTHDWIMLENRRPIPKKQPPEIIRFIRRPAKRGRKLK